ncbi:ribosomal-protein-alanine acetyltransferase [Desulfarculus baarsii DSM 2075]|uniref:[Ribosomal protein bS18]-alanine N-acetyltransferase n=1 Tax=Desulfarculus baarsii (strain ATCC 33931 / DSM 2075 / LMG 7858 / VKM B-1802 / 2st14) TaxID=644282 RepID=E1QL66_DESB2|nr:ribosomal-protein-alanine acetyltransferase [Desulfarculus baarsii DSM 2075]
MTVMGRDHLRQVSAIERASFSAPWPEHFFLAHTLHPNSLPLVALLPPAGLVVGHLIIWLAPGESLAQLQNLAVNEAFRRRGVAGRLLSHGLHLAKRRGAKRMRLEVRAGNRAAALLYERFGFRQTGLLPDYYAAEGEDALVMELALDDGRPAAGA